MSQLVDVEDYKCKFCDNRIISGYRCIDCYIKNIRTVPVIQDNTYKDLVPDDIHGISDLLGHAEPWIQTFTSTGNASNLAPKFKGTNVTPSSPTMGFSIGTNTCDGQNKVQGTWRPTGYLSNENVHSRRGSWIPRQLR